MQNTDTLSSNPTTDIKTPKAPQAELIQTLSVDTLAAANRKTATHTEPSAATIALIEALMSDGASVLAELFKGQAWTEGRPVYVGETIQNGANKTTKDTLYMTFGQIVSVAPRTPVSSEKHETDSATAAKLASMPKEKTQKVYARFTLDANGYSVDIVDRYAMQAAKELSVREHKGRISGIYRAYNNGNTLNDKQQNHVKKMGLIYFPKEWESMTTENYGKAFDTLINALGLAYETEQVNRVNTEKVTTGRVRVKAKA